MQITTVGQILPAVTAQYTSFYQYVSYQWETTFSIIKAKEKTWGEETTKYRAMRICYKLASIDTLYTSG